MLIEFSVGNYKSFKERVTFSMVAANIVAKDKTIDEDNVFAVDSELKLLKSAAIYGANASGKSNLYKALSFMKWFMINSSKETQSTEQIGVELFRLSTETENQPSFFEIVFILDNKKYRYGFEANRERVVSEWLYYVPKSRKTKLFERELDNIHSIKTYNAEGIEKRTRRNALFLSVSAQFNVEIAENILDWLTRKLQIVSGLNVGNYQNHTVGYLQNNENKYEIIKLIKKLDLGIDNIELAETEKKIGFFMTIKKADIFKENPNLFKDANNLEDILNVTISIKTIHQKFDHEGNYISPELFDLNKQESEGTQKVFAMAGLLVDTLEDGKILVIDEFDARLHPLISLAIVNLFNSREINPNNAQLIFMTHDTNLLSNKFFRRDQIWFTEKNRYGATDLYSLVEYKVPNDASFESDYIKGKYGAIPYIRSLSDLIESN